MNQTIPFLNYLHQSKHLSLDDVSLLKSKLSSQTIQPKEAILAHTKIDEPTYLNELAQFLSCKKEQLGPSHVQEEPLTLLPLSIAELHQAIPIQQNSTTTTLAISDLPAPTTTQDLSFILSNQVDYQLISTTKLEKLFDALKTKHTHPNTDQIEIDLPALNDLEQINTASDAVDQAPIIRYVNLLLYHVVKNKASDLHLEPFEDEFKIRCRIDGGLVELPSPPTTLSTPITSRIKVLSGLDIAESRLPQDGRIEFTLRGQPIDFRVSTLPTQFGESIVLRILDRSNVQLDINHLGMPPTLQETFIADIKKPNGIILVTGPTGSGKTTTLYAALQQLNLVGTKILTAEDPVEYDMEGIVQLPVLEKIGLTFSTALRAFLRQDPDVIMVGEIRDPETAEMAIQAALTGHMVFSTLHSNDSVGAISRLIDMQIKPYLIASTVEAIIAQRLIRTLCPRCKTTYTPEQHILNELNLNQTTSKSLFKAAACEECKHRGYIGRMPLFEYFSCTNSIRELILDNRPAKELKIEAIHNGMKTLREMGAQAFYNGITSADEIIKYT